MCTVKHFTGHVRTLLVDLVHLCNVQYNDTLFSMWLVNAPLVFRTVWAVLQRVVRSSTKEKIRIMGGSDVAKMKEEMAIMGLGVDAVPTFVPGGGHQGGARSKFRGGSIKSLSLYRSKRMVALVGYLILVESSESDLSEKAAA